MLTLQQIQHGITTCDSQLENLVSEIAKAGDKAAEAEVKFKTEFAKARLSARAKADDDKRKITVDEVEDRATEATEDSRRQHLIASHKLLILRESLRATQSRLDGLRSLLSSFKAAGG